MCDVFVDEISQFAMGAHFARNLEALRVDMSVCVMRLRAWITPLLLLSYKVDKRRSEWKCDV